MPGTKADLITVLRECCELLELSGENPFRCRAYENAARALEGIEGEPVAWFETGALDGVKGIGLGMLGNIKEWLAEGDLKLCIELRKKIPKGMMEIVRIPGVGPKKAKTLCEELLIDSIEKLEAAAQDGRIAALKGFGQKTAEKILAGIEQRRKFSERHLICDARAEADEILSRLKKLKSVKRVEVAGSLRRFRETVKDLDFVVESDHPDTVMEVFVKNPHVARVTGQGPTKSSVVLFSGIAADLRVINGDQYAPALNYFTGSKEHNTHLRGRAKQMGFKLNEYGLFKSDTETTVPLQTESALYEALHLRYVEPELREDMGEIGAAENDTLPRLITQTNMRGLLHCHTTYSDGHASLKEMAEAAKAAGYEYFGVCDHSPTAAYARGLSEETVLRQHEEIDTLNGTLKGITILKGIESDITADGKLDYRDAFLEKFDFIVASVHSRFQMSREEMTRRVCSAISQPTCVILGHPTGRLLLEREGYQLDIDAVLSAAAKHRVAIEINANPHRLDLDWRFVKQAKKAGCMFTINPDAHSTAGISDVYWGIGIARKGWLEAPDVINTMELEAFRSWLKQRRGATT